MILREQNEQNRPGREFWLVKSDLVPALQALGASIFLRAGNIASPLKSWDLHKLVWQRYWARPDDVKAAKALVACVPELRFVQRRRNEDQ